jgi:hypothetical protein
MLDLHNTQTDTVLASTAIAQSTESIARTSPSATEEWISGSAIASSLTDKWLCEIDDPDAIADLLNWTYYGHSGGWFVKSVNPPPP